MSYILDALKKADRERNLAKVPTLTSVHVPVYVTGRRFALWIVTVTLLGGGALAWFLLSSPRGASVSVSPAPVGAPASVAVTPPTDTGEVDNNMSAPREVIGPPPTPSTQAAPSRPTASTRSEGRRQPDDQPTPSPRAGRPAPRVSPPLPAPIRSEGADVRPAEPEPPALPTPRPEARPNVEASRPPTEVAPGVPPPTSPAPPTLRDALAKMTLDVFVYTDVEADRMAVINGRRYVKGQLVDGLYLVEGISPEGVVLKYQGERAVLRP